MKIIITIVCVSIFISCRQSGKNSDIENNKTEIINENISESVIKEPEECKPIGNNPWQLLSSRFNTGLPEDYFLFFTQKELIIIRNSIYAEKGYIFKNTDLATFFSSQKWYCPKYDNVDSLISNSELNFINYLLKLEKKASNHYEEKEIREYFLNLFLTKPDIGYNPIPLYFHKKYLHNEYDYKYSACNIINSTDEYMAFVYNVWNGDASDGLFYLTVLDKELNLIENHQIEQYEVKSKDEVIVYITRINYNPNGRFYDEEKDKHYFIDTISRKDYILDNNGRIKIIERTK